MAATTENINNTFFDGIYKDVWRQLIPNGLSEAEVDFIVEVAGLQQNDSVLDIMCGYGRHALELGNRGMHVTAIDNLPAYIEEIRKKAVAASVPVTAVLSGALEMKLTQEYDAAVCMGNSFAFFNKEDCESMLKNISAHLKPGGVLVINSWMIAEIAIKHFREKDWHQVNDYKYLLDYKFLFNPSRIESEQTIVSPEGGVEVLHGIDYIFTLDELETMFAEVGMTTRALYATPRKRPFIFGDSRVYIVVEKLS